MKLALTAFALIAAPVTAIAQTAPVPAAETARLTLDTPIETIAADEKGKAVLEANFPGIDAHPHYEMFKSMSINQLQPMAGGLISAEAMAKTQVELAAIK